MSSRSSGPGRGEQHHGGRGRKRRDGRGGGRRAGADQAPGAAPRTGAEDGPGAARAGAGGPAPERVGPLAITRLHKEDGRALILYRRIGAGE